MTKTEARKALLEGKKVKQPDWSHDEFIYFDFDKMRLFDEVGLLIDFFLIAEDGWELYKEKQTVTLYRYTVKDRNGHIRQLDWIDENASRRVNNSLYDVLKIEEKEVEI